MARRGGSVLYIAVLAMYAAAERTVSERCTTKIATLLHRQEKEFDLSSSCETHQMDLRAEEEGEHGERGECRRESLAFIIMIDERQTLESTQRLVRRLASPSSSVLLHVDNKSSALFRDRVLQLEQELVRVLPRAVSSSIAWGGSNLLQAELEAMRFLVQHEEKWQHVLVLSGTDYPVKSVGYMSSVLFSIGAKSCLEIFPQDGDVVRARGMNRMFVECEDYVHVVGNKTRALPLKMWGGSAWITLHREFVEFVVGCLFEKTSRRSDSFFQTAHRAGQDIDNDCKLVVDLLEWAENSLSSEEIFFHTVLMNSRFCSSLYPDYLRWVKWQAGSKGVHCDKADWCGKSPQFLRMRDVRTALSSRALFARKFDVRSQTLQDFVDDVVSGEHVFSRRLKVSSATTGSRKNNSVLDMFDGCEFSGLKMEVQLQPVLIEFVLEKETSACSLTITSDLKLNAVNFQLFFQDGLSGEFIRAYGNKHTDYGTERVVRNWKIATVKLPNATRARRFLAKFSDYSQEIIIFELQLNACPQAQDMSLHLLPTS